MMTEATQDSQATATEPLTFDVVVDCGNANVKATLVKGATIVKTISYGSRIRFTNVHDVHLAWAGFTLGNKSVNVGDNCNNTGDVIVIGNDSQGKLKYLQYLLAGVCSAFSFQMPIGSHLRFHILTLSTDVRRQVELAVQSLTDLKVDGIERNYTVELVQLLPEGAGCSYFISSKFKSAKAIAVLDIGSGTMNLSSYTLVNSIPQRTSFEFEGVGISQFKSELHDFIKLTTTNGRVNKTYVEYALAENRSTLMDGTDISKSLEQAVASWTSSTEVKGMLTKSRHILATGGYVGCCGGGWKIQLVRDALVKQLLGDEPTEELQSRLLVPDEADVLGVLGVAKSLVQAVRNAQKSTSKRKSKAKKQEDLTNATGQASEQPTESTPETLAGVSEASNSQQPTSGGTDESSALGVAETIEHPAHTEATAN